MSSSSNEIFTTAFEDCKKEIPFVKEWSNSTGYFDYAVYGGNAPKLANGEMIKSCTPGGRRILIIGTRLGNLAVFDRFKDQRPGEPGAEKAVFVYNCTSAIKVGAWFSQGSLGEYEMGTAVGDHGEGNLGWRIEQLASALKK